MLNNDYRDILRILLKNEARFLIVGAYAMSAYGYSRATGDVDIWVEATKENSIQVYTSLKEFGAPLSQIDTHTFATKGIVFQIGVAPCRIDIITYIDGVEFQEAFDSKKIIEIDDLAIPFLSKENLIKNKSSTHRKKDQLDVEYLLNGENMC